MIRSSSYSNALIRSSSRLKELRLGNGPFDEMVADIAGDECHKSRRKPAMLINKHK